MPLGYCAARQWLWGLHPHDIWLAIVLGHATRCFLSVTRFRQGRWERIEVEITSAAG